MPRPSLNETAMTGAEPQARYRGVHAAGRRSRIQRWNDTITVLTDLQLEYAAWLEALPDNQHEGAVAGALRAIADLDLSGPQAIEPPRGFGRD